MKQELLRSVLARHTGFRHECIRTEALRVEVAACAAEGIGFEELLAGVQAGNARFLQRLVDCITVPETFFYRQAEQLELLTTHALPVWRATGRPTFRAWSAGCATGEEAYSLAAVISSWNVCGSVLGTDICERNIHVAQEARYGRWSLRVSAPVPVALFESVHDRFQVRSELRAMTSFATHNLLDPAPVAHAFDVVFCRNVLVYFSPEAARRAVRNITASLAPGGLLVCAPMDLPEPPPGLVPVGAQWPGAWMLPAKKVAKAEVRTPPPALLPAPALPQATVQEQVSPVPMHLSALDLLERQQWESAARALDTLRAAAPAYLPALLERALLHQRRGEVARAAELMRELKRRAAEQGDAWVDAPEPLPATYFLSTAEAFLSRLGGRA